VFPLLIGGALRVIDAAERGRPAAPTAVFDTFRAGQGGGRLIGFGLLMTALYLLVFGVLIGSFGPGLPEWYAQMMQRTMEAGWPAAAAGRPPRAAGGTGHRGRAGPAAGHVPGRRLGDRFRPGGAGRPRGAGGRPRRARRRAEEPAAHHAAGGAVGGRDGRAGA